MIIHLVVQQNLFGKELRDRVIAFLEFYKEKAKDHQVGNCPWYPFFFMFKIVIVCFMNQFSLLNCWFVDLGVNY